MSPLYTLILNNIKLNFIVFICIIFSICRRRVSRGGNISPILEGDESIETGNNFYQFIKFKSIRIKITFSMIKSL